MISSTIADFRRELKETIPKRVFFSTKVRYTDKEWFTMKDGEDYYAFELKSNLLISPVYDGKSSKFVKLKLRYLK